MGPTASLCRNNIAYMNMPGTCFHSTMLYFVWLEVSSANSFNGAGLITNTLKSIHSLAMTLGDKIRSDIWLSNFPPAFLLFLQIFS